MELHKISDLLDSIKYFLISRRKELNTVESRRVHPRILNQEQDGSILYTWNDFSPLTKTDTPVTHVGVFDTINQTHKVIWIYNQKIKIVSCSINQERTLLAFTLVAKCDVSEEPHCGKEKYSAFLAELQATGERVFSLNLERSNFLKVQFLYPTKVNTTREAHMVVFLHKESVGLYHIPLARMGDNGIIMNDQPRTEQVVKKFVWCQWDVQEQRLHYIHNTRHSNNPDKVYPKYSCLQFYQDARFDNMLDVPLNFPFPYIRSASRCRYGDLALNTGIPDIDLNIQILSQSNGTICICYQHLIRSRKPQKHCDDKDDDDEFDINYYICMLHHAKILHGCINGLHKSSTRSKRVHFQWSGDYLMVLLPGVFVHLLNVSMEYEPCHHILLHNKVNNSKQVVVSSSGSSPASPFLDEQTSTSHSLPLEAGTSTSDTSTSQDENTEHSISETQDILPDTMSVTSDEGRLVRSLTACNGFTRESSGSGFVYDQNNGVIWKISLNLELLVQYFHTSSWTTQLAILHYILTRSKDLFFIRTLFKYVCEDVTNSKVRIFMAEYLVASTYMNMKHQLERNLLHLLPFTSIEPFKGQLEKSQSEERMATITYSTIDSIIITAKTTRERNYRHSGDLWDAICRYLQLKQIEPTPRFKYDMVKNQLEKPAKDKENDTQSERINFLEKIEKHLHRQSPVTPNRPSASLSITESVIGNTPEFLHQGHGETNFYNTKLSQLVQSCLTDHLEQQLRKDWKAKAKHVAQEYVTCQVQHSKQLCHLIWSLKQPALQLEEEDAIPKLYESGSDIEYDMFMLFERFFMVVKEYTFPFPLGFQTFFTALGFRCLNFNLFMQYVERGVLQLTGGFIAQLLTDSMDDGEDFQTKYHIISKLPKEFAEECFKQWKHPFSSIYLAKQQAAHILKLGKDIDRSKLEKKSRVGHLYNGNSSVAGTEVMTFAPLTSFLKHLEETASVIASRRKRSDNESPIVDPMLLQEAALYNTKTQNVCNLSLVNF